MNKYVEAFKKSFEKACLDITSHGDALMSDNVAYDIAWHGLSHGSFVQLDNKEFTLKHKIELTEFFTKKYEEYKKHPEFMMNFCSFMGSGFADFEKQENPSFNDLITKIVAEDKNRKNTKRLITGMNIYLENLPSCVDEKKIQKVTTTIANMKNCA